MSCSWSDLLFGLGINVEETLHDLVVHDGLRDDLRDILGLDLEVGYLIRMDDDDRPSFTVAVAAGLPDVYLLFDTLFFDLCLQGCCYL